MEWERENEITCELITFEWLNEWERTNDKNNLSSCTPLHSTQLNSDPIRLLFLIQDKKKII